MQRILYTFLLLCSLNITYAQYPIIELMDEYSLDDLQVIMGQVADQAGDISGLVAQNFAVNAYKVTYQTDDPRHPLGEPHPPVEVTGVIVVPQGSACEFPMATYIHGTTATKNGVASYGSAELNIGLIFSMVGNVVVMPDLIGLGDSPGLHPYHHSESTAWCAVDLMRVARDHADELGFKLNDQLFTFGYSQGGHGAMALHKYIQENLSGEFTVTASVPMSGAYDISGVQAQTVISNEGYSSPGYLPYIILGLNQIYNVFEDPIEVFIEPYATDLPPLFDGETGFGTINQSMPPSGVPNEILQPDVLDDFINNPDSEFKALFAEQDVYDWVPTSPIRMVYCTEDEQVFWQNATVAEAQFLENGVDADLVQALNFGALDHGGCVGPALLGGNAYFGSMSVIYNGITHESDVTLPAGADGTDGAISIDATGGEGALSYNWSNGATGTSIANLSPGIYEVTISDDTGCEVKDEFDLNVVSVDDLAVQELEVFPNPANESVNIELPLSAESYTVSLRDVTGREVFTQHNVQGETYAITVSDFIPGAYVLHLQTKENRYVAKLLVK